MDITLQNANALLASGQFEQARQMYEVINTKQPTLQSWLGVIETYKALNLWDLAITAADEILALSPQNMIALIAKGDFYDKKGDTKTAGPFYGKAMSVAAAQNQQSIPPQVMSQLIHAQTKCEAYAKNYEQYLYDALSHKIDTTKPGPFLRSMDIMFGKSQPYLQQPSQYYFPELPAIPFFESNSFAWSDALEKHTDAIKTELLTNIDKKSAFDPYVQQTHDTPNADHAGMMDNKGWSALFLWKNGKRIEENISKFPMTTQAMEAVHKADIPGHSPTVLFSLLRPGVKIPPHTGLMNSRLICHLPIIIPEHCGLRVGSQIHTWQEGETVIFDDTIEHEAWNNSHLPRYVLIFDTPHPMISTTDHQGVKALFSAILNHK